MYLPEHPRPWSIETTDTAGTVKDGDGRSVATFDVEDDIEFWMGLVEIVNEHDRDRHHDASTPGMSP